MKNIKILFVLLALNIASACNSNGKFYDEAAKRIIAMADEALEAGVIIANPIDAVGGENYNLMNWQRDHLAACGTAYRLTSDVRYAQWISDILGGYAEIYPNLDYHPESWRTAEPGKLYWQVLEESSWLFYAASGYLDAKEGISRGRQSQIELGLFRLAANFLMYGTPDNGKNNFVFNRMHNHGTWQAAAVGAIGLAIGERDFVMKSLYGTDLSGEHGGILQQIDTLFSPDGYYMEGTSYQSYALIPFLRYGMLLRREMPDLDYLERNDCILAKSADAMFALSYGNGFFRLNDSSPKTFGSADLAKVLPYLYYINPERKWLLSIISDYGIKVEPDEAGLRVSKDISRGLSEPFIPASSLVSDGAKGEKGATMVLRAGDGGSSAVYMKACGQGSYHGHFDKLTIGYFDNGHEILTEYGSARFNSIGPRNAGHYTALNRGYAMTTVAHNTLVVDQTSNFEGVTPWGLPHSPSVTAFKGDGSDFQYMAAKDSTAYPGTCMERWVALIRTAFLERPFVADILIARSDKPHRYDYPIHYTGELIDLNVPYSRAEQRMEPSGRDFGYQHLWLEAEGAADPQTTRYTWLCGGRFYTLSTATTTDSRVMLMRSGANDKDFFLRSEPVYMIRENGKKDHVFASCLESHGDYNPADEACRSPYPECLKINVLNTSDKINVTYCFKGGNSLTLSISGNKMEIL